MTIAVAVLVGLMAQPATEARLPEGCPRVSLSYSGGLGFEDRWQCPATIWKDE